MKETEIGYTTEGVEKQYSADIFAAKSADDLRRVLVEWKWCADDALATIKDIDWEDFQRGLKLEHKGEFAGESWTTKYGAIVAPEKMIRTRMVADQFKVPWGLAWIRQREEAAR